MAAVGDVIRVLLEHRNGIAHRNAKAAAGEQGSIVLSVADADHFMERNARVGKQSTETAAFVDAGRKCHDLFAVEVDPIVQIAAANGLAHCFFVGLTCGDDDIADTQRLNMSKFSTEYGG